MAKGRNIRKWLYGHDLTLTWLWKQVRPRGFMSLHYDRFTRIVNGTYFGGNSDQILEAAEQVIDEYDPKSA